MSSTKLPEQIAMGADVDKCNLMLPFGNFIDQQKITFDMTFMTALIFPGKQMVLILKRQ